MMKPLGFLLMVIAFIAGPILMIMAINWAFATTIPITLWSWFVFLVISVVVAVVLGFVSGLGKAMMKLR
jgi:chromate transport protein ChrA